MNREQLIREVQRAAGFDEHDELTLNLVQARIILDTILPQVTTVEELEAVPRGAVLLDCDSEPMHKISRFTLTEEAIEDTAPLTVVWTPGDRR